MCKPQYAALARREIERLRQRDRSLPPLGGRPILFRDPAWEIVLDLYSAHLEGRDISLSSACIVAGIPYATACRVIGRLVDAGLITRRNGSKDHRLVYLEVTDRARAALDRYFDLA